jgi:hypothetical protein
MPSIACVELTNGDGAERQEERRNERIHFTNGALSTLYIILVVYQRRAVQATRLLCKDGRDCTFKVSGSSNDGRALSSGSKSEQEEDELENKIARHATKRRQHWRSACGFG